MGREVTQDGGVILLHMLEQGVPHGWAFERSFPVAYGHSVP